MNCFCTELISIYAKKAFIKCSLFDIGEKVSPGITSPVDTIPNTLGSKARVQLTMHLKCLISEFNPKIQKLSQMH